MRNIKEIKYKLIFLEQVIEDKKNGSHLINRIKARDIMVWIDALKWILEK